MLSWFLDRLKRLRPAPRVAPAPEELPAVLPFPLSTVHGPVIGMFDLHTEDEPPRTESRRSEAMRLALDAARCGVLTAELAFAGDGAGI